MVNDHAECAEGESAESGFLLEDRWRDNTVGPMGRNKHLRKLIAGWLDSIGRHQETIRHEMLRETPQVGRIRHRAKEIDTAQKKVRKLEQRLRR